MGDTIAIEKLSDKIIINNKGELLFPEKDFGKRSEVRNRLLADLLTRTIYMEKAGTGIKRVNNVCKKNKVVFEFTDAFRITIYSNKKLNNVVDKKLKEVLNLIKNNHKISATQIAESCNVSSRTAQRYLKQLKDSNKIKRIGDERTGYWEVLVTK